MARAYRGVRKQRVVASLVVAFASASVEAQGGTLIVAIPTTDTVLCIAEDTPGAIGALQALVNRIMLRAPNKLSATLLRWRSSGWEVVAR